MKFFLLFLLNFAFVAGSYSQNVQTVKVVINNDSIKHEKNPVFVKVDKMPEFIGGKSGLLKFYHKHSYFKINSGPDNSETVYFSIVINKDGSVSDFKVLQGYSEELEEETRRIIKVMPKWMPGKNKGKPVRVQEMLSINYAISPR